MSQQTSKCSNCRAQIAETVFALHEIYCIRNNIECKRCGQFFDKNDPQSHEEEFHKGTPCEFCKEIFQDISKHTKCLKKPVQCIHCGLDQTKDQIFQHENICGSRTERCDICKQYIMIRELTKHVATCVPPKPKEQVQEKQPTQKTVENRQISQQPQQIAQPPKPDYKNFDYKYKHQVEAEQVSRPQQQVQAKHEIFGYEKPSLPYSQQQSQQQQQQQAQQIRQPINKYDKPIEVRADNHSQNRKTPQQYYNPSQQQQQIAVEQKYKPKEYPLQPTNVIKRQASGNQEVRNVYPQQEKLTDKYSYQQSNQQKLPDRKPNDQRQYDPNSYLNRQQENKYYDNKQLEVRGIDKKQSDQNLHRQYSQQPQQKKQQQPKAVDDDIDYLALGLTREEIEQQKAYLESLQQQRKPQEAQLKPQEYKPRQDYYQAARAYK
ncbi:unnamed protein product (macronuclear) [Paramecium tetraurelia]|uniref:TRAFD1/XAF1 zinc finger domain-containing protein n=1 Tax=Paramecium tetraurelia TaxID=5888 RepID=A0EH64_PARTE|nr:uncharacterized protein GSPATT00026979001 [Paramecium tetraurelia]CAK94655.1 unnamed protein product [Paramecium tetraurelia]|eukprot:XP_001462028.1 hypothetical protein (macronuclear) [Paramecium tetraurelia strain d4-2]